MSDLRQIALEVPTELFNKFQAAGGSAATLAALLESYNSRDLAVSEAKPLGHQTNAWLRARAERDGIDLGDASTKAEILAAMQQSYFPSSTVESGEEEDEE